MLILTRRIGALLIIELPTDGEGRVMLTSLAGEWVRSRVIPLQENPTQLQQSPGNTLPHE